MPFEEDEVPESAFSTEALSAKVREQEGEPEPAPQTDEVVLEEKEDRPRDDKGRFAKTEEEEPQAPILGKFKTVDDLVRSYEELERQRGEQSGELGDLRQRVQQWEQYQQQAQTQTPLGTIQQLREDGRYQEAAALALHSGDYYLYDGLLREWGEDEPYEASNFRFEVRLAQMQQSLADQYTKEQQPIQQHVQDQQLTTAWYNVSQRIPGIADLTEEMLEAAQEAPEILQALKGGSPQDTERMFENLAWLARGKKADQVAVQQQELTSAQAEANDNARLEAVVATASSNNATREEKSPIDEWKEAVFHNESPRSLRLGLGEE